MNERCPRPSHEQNSFFERNNKWIKKISMLEKGKISSENEKCSEEKNE
jgi:hypothetical protein